jgi:hypothetical protein
MAVPTLYLCRGRQFLDGLFAFFLPVRLVEHDRVERPEFADPCGAGERPAGVGIPGPPALADARWPLDHCPARDVAYEGSRGLFCHHKT